MISHRREGKCVTNVAYDGCENLQDMLLESLWWLMVASGVLLLASLQYRVLLLYSVSERTYSLLSLSVSLAFPSLFIFHTVPQCQIQLHLSWARTFSQPIVSILEYWQAVPHIKLTKHTKPKKLSVHIIFALCLFVYFAFKTFFVSITVTTLPSSYFFLPHHY